MTARMASTGRTPQYGKITTQGFLSLSVADVDGDGKQEIVYGCATINEDGSVLYSRSILSPRPPLRNR